MSHPNDGLNPIVPGFHPDPTVCRVGDEFFLATSSFTYMPGVPIFRSRNLIDWEQIGNALDRPSQLDLSLAGSSSAGIYAPTLRHHEGRFWLITTSVTDGGLHNFIVTAEDPAGPWSDPVPVGVIGIDPDLAWDDDGNCWVHYSIMSILRCRIDDVTGTVLEAPEPVWSGTGLHAPEGPHLFRRDSIWYLLIAEGGTERGHAVSIARGPSPKGPWEDCPANPILSHRSTNHPIQNTGHSDLVEAPDGSWWMVLLGVRPKGTTPRFHVLGRETFLAPVEWVDGWPVVGPVELELPRRVWQAGQPTTLTGRDDFDQPVLHPRWLGIRRLPNEIASLSTRPGWLTITGSDATLDDPMPSFVGRRQQHVRCRARVLVEPGSSAEAGLAVRMDERAHYHVALTGEHLVARARIGPLLSVVGEVARPAGPVVLVIETKEHPDGPDSVCLGYEHGGVTTFLAELDGRYLSTEVTGGFIGRVIGMYVVGGEAAFDWFDYQDLE